MFFIVIIMFLFCDYETKLNLRKKSIFGKMSYKPKFPLIIPSKSCIMIKLEDIRKQGSPSTTIGSQLIRSPMKADAMTYSVRLPNKDIVIERFKYVLSAVLNIGWCGINSREEWFRKGDYLTDKKYFVNETVSECWLSKKLCGPNIILKKVAEWRKPLVHYLHRNSFTGKIDFLIT